MKIAVVLVTYNRLDCLKKALEMYELQIKKPEYVIVVNNASTDGTTEFLDAWHQKESSLLQKHVLHCKTNTGGAGGFATGMEYAVNLDCDFLFLADDDAFADPHMLEQLEYYYQANQKMNIAAMCTAMKNQGEWDYSQRSHLKVGWLRLQSIPTTVAEHKKEGFCVDILSFVGAAIRRDVVQKIGLPIKEYFIHFDDTEYSLRIRQCGEIHCVSSSIMHHDTNDTHTITWKNYYSLRNAIICYRTHFPKRYYWYLVIARYIKYCSPAARIIWKRTKGQIRIHKVALKDGLQGKSGLSEVYKPGVNIEIV